MNRDRSRFLLPEDPLGEVPGDESQRPSESLMARYLPLGVLVAVGTAIGGVTLYQMLSRAGVERVRTMVVFPSAGAEDPFEDFLELVSPGEIAQWVERLADPALGGRDAPSPGLDRAQEMVAAAFRDLGLERAPDATKVLADHGGLERAPADPVLAGYFRPFRKDAAFFGRLPYERPEPRSSWLEITGSGADVRTFTLGVDFVPLSRSCEEDPVFRGKARGEVVEAGFGIDHEPLGYDDFEGLELAGKVVMVLDGEPDGEPPGSEFEDHFRGPELSAEACLWNKVDALHGKGAAAVLIVAAPPGPLAFRSTYAYWNPPSMDRVRAGLPTLLVTEAAAAEIRRAPEGARVSLGAGTERRPAELRNVVGVLPPEPGQPYLIVGAHMDHIGTGPRGRIGRGADDNGSGVAAMLQVAKVLSSKAGRERLGGAGVIFCAFTGEEDGLVGSREFAAHLPLPKERCRAMLNLDMIGRGPEDQAVVLGLDESPGVRAPFQRALAKPGHGLSSVKDVRSRAFFQRSDHFAFHEVGLPSVFLFEDWPHESLDYHTWLDVPEAVSPTKIASVARLSTWLAYEFLR